MPSVCLDASFALAILFDDDFSDIASVWWAESVASGLESVVPAMFHAEMTSAIRRRVFLGTLLTEEAEEILEKSLAWPVTIWQEDKSRLQRRAYELATRFNRPRAYDSQYLAVADILGCELWTADERLANTVGGELPWVRWIGAAA